MAVSRLIHTRPRQLVSKARTLLLCWPLDVLYNPVGAAVLATSKASRRLRTSALIPHFLPPNFSEVLPPSFTLQHAIRGASGAGGIWHWLKQQSSLPKPPTQTSSPSMHVPSQQPAMPLPAPGHWFSSIDTVARAMQHFSTAPKIGRPPACPC